MIPTKQFPLSRKPGSKSIGINITLTHQHIRQKPPISKHGLEKIIIEHQGFLANGGAGGMWKTLLIKGIVTGIYQHFDIKEGKQACFENIHLSSDLSFNEIELPFANFCSTYAEAVDFSNADLSHCLMTDAMLAKANFLNTILINTDFSRANLKGASFVNANCAGVDFENCNLENADFTGARIDSARFPGTNLKGVIC